MIEKIRIRTGLTLVVGLFFVALMTSALLSSFSSQKSYDGMQRLNLVAVQQVYPLYETSNLLTGTRILLADSYLDLQNGQADRAAADLERAKSILQDADKRMTAYLAVAKSEEGERRARNVEQAYKAYHDAITAQMKTLETGSVSSNITISTTDVRQARNAFETAMHHYFDRTTEVSQEELAGAAQRNTTSWTVTAVAIALAFILISGCTLFIRRGVLRPLREAAAQFDRIAQGDLTFHIDVRSNNEIGALMTALRRMQDGLTRTISRVRRAAQEIHTGSSEISVGNLDLSSRTEQQAASLQETAASMEELAATVKQNADNANQANQLAAQSRTVAQRGGQTVSLVVSTMRDISDSSSKMADIVGVIDSIAFQTNILALNAAVEAARAGDQGKGFAVVASEVRTLAQRSALAAKEIKQLIDNSLQKVSTGSTQAEEAGVTMQEIEESVQRVTDIMGEISAASEEQSSGINQVNMAVSQMDVVTQQNAALVEESAAAAASLKAQADQLVEVVSIFRTSSGYVIDEQESHHTGGLSHATTGLPSPQGY